MKREIIDNNKKEKKTGLSEKEWAKWKKERRKYLQEEILGVVSWLENTDMDSITRSELKTKLKELGYYEAALKAMDYPVKETKEMSYGDGLRIRFVYENHTLDHNPDVIKGVKAWFYELIRPDVRSLSVLKERELAYDLKIKNVVSGCAVNNIPIYLVDVNGERLCDLDNKDFNKMALTYNVAQLVKTLTAVNVGKAVIIRISDKLFRKELSRRDFLKSSVAVSTGAFLMEKGIGDLVFPTKIPDKQEQFNMKRRVSTRAIEATGLVDMVILFRNLIMAIKIKDIQKEYESRGEEAYFGVQVGKYHSRLENLLAKNKEELLAMLKRIIEKHRKELVNLQEEEVALITRLEKINNRWIEEDKIVYEIVKACRIEK
jgi:hypothetical protein